MRWATVLCHTLPSGHAASLQVKKGTHRSWMETSKTMNKKKKKKKKPFLFVSWLSWDFVTVTESWLTHTSGALVEGQNLLFKCDPQTSSIDITGGWLEILVLRMHPRPSELEFALQKKIGGDWNPQRSFRNTSMRSDQGFCRREGVGQVVWRGDNGDRLKTL